MTTSTQTAYAPGSTNASSTTGVVLGIAQAASKALGFGGSGGGVAQGAMGGVGVGVSTSSTAASGNSQQNSGYQGQDFNVNFGNGVSQGAGIPAWALVAVGLVGLWWYMR